MGASRVYSRAERAFIPEHHFASELFAAVREALSNMYLHTAVLNITVLQLVTEFWDAKK